MEHLNNPFVIYGYKGAEYFCDREDEAQTLTKALHNERNVVLISPRRIGKTGLIHHVFAQMAESEPEVKCFYMDVNSTRSLTQFVNLLAKSIIGKLDTPSQSALKKIMSFFSSFKPTMGFDALDGTPTFSLAFAPHQKEESLKRIFDYLAQSEKRIYIAIDEFQQIATYPEQNSEALLRSYIQFLPNVYFIFAGSKQHVMADMFLSAKRPFYQSAQILSLPLIDMVKYEDFANRHLAAKSLSISHDDFEHLYTVLNGQTWYVQSVLNRLYANGSGIDRDAIDNTIRDLVNENECVFASYYDSLTANQAALITAIAIEGKAASVLSHNFISRHHLPATSSVSLALKTLMDRELLYKDNGTYVVYDRFFSLWLKGLSEKLGA